MIGETLLSICAIILVISMFIGLVFFDLKETTYRIIKLIAILSATGILVGAAWSWEQPCLSTKSDRP